MNDLYKAQGDIIVTKQDEVYAKIHCEEHVAKELSEYFTFFVPGFQYTPAFRQKKWDGKIRLFDLRSHKIYLGLLTYLNIFAEERDYKIVLADEIAVKEDFSLYLAKKFAESLNVHSAGRKISVHDYQIEAFAHVMRDKRALLLSPTASGKSLIIYMLVRQMLDFKKKKKGLIIVPTTSLVEQLSSDFADYSDQNEFEVEEYVHKIYEGRSKNTDKKVTISTWQSLYTQPDEYFQQFDFVIGDEAHLFKAQSLTKILTCCTNADYRVGLTGTLDGTKTHKLVLEGLFGDVRQVITTKELIDTKKVSALNIKCLILKHPQENLKGIAEWDYQKELEYLFANHERNKFIRNLTISMKKNTLVLFSYVDKHGKILYDMLNNAKLLGDRKLYFIHGGVDTDERETIRAIVEKEENAIIIASYGTFSTGVNIRNLHNVIFASPSKSRIRNLQSIGRALRKSDSKDSATLYDIADDLRVGDRMNMTLRHFVERVKIYTSEKFPFKIYKIGLKNG